MSRLPLMSVVAVVIALWSSRPIRRRAGRLRLDHDDPTVTTVGRSDPDGLPVGLIVGPAAGLAANPVVGPVVRLVDRVGAAALAVVPVLGPAPAHWVGGAIVGAPLALVSIGPPAAVVPIAALLVVRRRVVVARRRSADRLLIEVGAVVDVVRVAVSGGLGVAGALDAAHRHVPPDRDAGLSTVVRGTGAGDSLDAALRAWTRSTGPPVGELTAVLRAADRGGVVMLDALADLGRDLRRRRRVGAERRARQLSVTLLLPLVLCVLPSFILLTVVPTAVVGLGPLIDR